MENKNIYIGNKPVMNYVLAVVTQINIENNSVSIKARGRTISKAVDIAEIVKNRFIPEIQIEDINIGTEKIENDGKEKNVSIIEIRLKK